MSRKNEERKNEVFLFIENHIRENGTSPGTEEIGKSLNLAKSTVSKYVNRLIDEGVLTRHKRYGLVSSEMGYPRARMKIIGTVACGKPRLADEDVKGYITVDEDILGGVGEYFALVAEGDSMIDVGIHDGDILYIEKSDYAENGNIVVALIEDEQTGEPKATLKRFFKDEENHRFILHPENRLLEDIVVTELKILGIARHVLRTL